MNLYTKNADQNLEIHAKRDIVWIEIDTRDKIVYKKGNNYNKKLQDYSICRYFSIVYTNYTNSSSSVLI